MNISEYFNVVSVKDRVFHFQLKGFWSEEVATQIEPHFLKQFKEAVDSMRGQKFLVLADTTEFKTPTSKAKELMGQTMMYAKEHNIYKTVEVVPSAIMKLSIKEAAQSSGKDDFRVVVASVEEGWAEIDRLKQEL